MSGRNTAMCSTRFSGIIKVVLSLQHATIPPHLHLKKLSPNIALDRSFVIPTAALQWEPHLGRRVAGVSSFGFGGTNAHLVLGEAPAQSAVAVSPPDEGSPTLLPISARSQEALAAVAGLICAGTR